MRSRYVQILRIAVQWGFLLYSLWLGTRLFLFVSAIRGGESPTVVRGSGVEGFLPILGLMGLRDWVESGRLNPVHPAATLILLMAIAVSFLLRRSFCSWVCPVGTLSELLWKRGFSLFRRNFRLPPWGDYPLRVVKYLLLVFFVVSIFRMPSQALRRFLFSGYSAVADVRLLDFFLHLSATAAIVIATLLFLSLLLRNPFCRYLCPYGALVGLLGWISPVAVTRYTTHCVTCGVCNQVCPSHLPIMQRERTRSPECIGCFRCVSNCRADGAIEMALPGGRPVVPGIVFALMILAIFWGGSIFADTLGHWDTILTPDDYRRLLSPRQ
ncbi:MAG: 4Fe-4S binding protein [Desulfuromonadia bacterium]